MSPLGLGSHGFTRINSKGIIKFRVELILMNHYNSPFQSGVGLDILLYLS